MEKASLSEKQNEVLKIIEEELLRTGRPPTYREIAHRLGLAAVGTVQDHIRALLKKGFLQQEPGVARGFRLPHRSASRDIPVLGAVPAGNPIEATELRLGSLALSTGTHTSGISEKSALTSELFALRVTGESMILAGIMDGDYVIVKKQSTALNGDIVVALIDGEVTVKRLEKKGPRVRLLPENPDTRRYQPIEISSELQNTIQGKVISVQRYYGS